jgi:8-hydroxy-5-deazaflavin:NADPH oxidoreductase
LRSASTPRASSCCKAHAQTATFFKAFNVTGASTIAGPRYPQGLAAAFVAGPRGPKKDVVMALVRDVGLEAVDAGELRAARLLEPLGLLMMMQLEETGSKGSDVAFVLGSRMGRQAEPYDVLAMETREAG